jgi:uncharacterized membrane protein YjgN (DUF898 family)
MCYHTPASGGLSVQQQQSSVPATHMNSASMAGPYASSVRFACLIMCTALYCYLLYVACLCVLCPVLHVAVHHYCISSTHVHAQERLAADVPN